MGHKKLVTFPIEMLWVFISEHGLQAKKRVRED